MNGQTAHVQLSQMPAGDRRDQNTENIELSSKHSTCWSNTNYSKKYQSTFNNLMPLA